jgi:hypothetical protein
MQGVSRSVYRFLSSDLNELIGRVNVFCALE